MRTLTLILFKYSENRRRERLVFGNALAEKGDSCTKLMWFEPGEIVGLEKWRAGKYGTVRWEVFIIRTVAPGEIGNEIPGVSPGAEILLYVRGKHNVRRVKDWLKTVDSKLLTADIVRSAASSLRAGSHPRGNSNVATKKIIRLLNRRKF